MIVKVQIPLAGSLPPEEWLALIYDRKRLFYIEVPIDPAMKKRMGNSPKKFFEVMLRNGRIDYLKEVEDQGW